MWGWICKYGDMVRKTRQLEEKVTATEEFIDITRPLKKAATEEKIIYASNSTIRIFKNGYSILCDIDRLSSSTRKCCEKVTMNACNFRC